MHCLVLRVHCCAYIFNFADDVCVSGLAILAAALALCWTVSFVALLFATDLPLCKNTALAKISHHGKLSTLQRDSPKVHMLAIPTHVAWTLFYGFACIWNTVWTMVLVVGWLSEPSHSFIDTTLAVKTSLFLQIHLTRRLYECLNVTKFSKRPLHPLNFCAGFGFYVLLSPTMFVSSTLCLANPPRLVIAVTGLVVVVVCNLGQVRKLFFCK